ncbi:hypothetical protein BA894_23585 [Vibrio natriegens]|nr:hypothetical protein BA894_23585 [Vibrio natriegens]
MHKQRLSPKVLIVEDKRKAVKVMQKHSLSTLLVSIQRTSIRYQPQTNREDDKLYARIKELALERTQYGLFGS